MYPSTSFWGIMYTQYILPRSYVSQTYPSKKLCTPRAYFHHLTHITYKYVVYMRCHHKILIIDFQIYFMHSWFPKYQTINNIDSQIKIWVHNSASCRKSNFCNHEVLLMLFSFLQVGALIPYLHMLPKTWTSTYNISSSHNLKSAKHSQLATMNLQTFLLNSSLFGQIWKRKRKNKDTSIQKTMTRLGSN